MIRRSLAVGLTFLFFALSLASFGCDNTSDCEEFCKKQSECCPAEASCHTDGGTDVPTCVRTCEAISKKDATYKDALADTADCYGDSSCEEIANGMCAPQP